jgi:non-specific protein-tyrosine kinase
MNDFIELRRVLSIISHRWYWLIILPIIYGGLGYLATKTQTPVYTATTTMLAGDIISATDLNRQEIAASDLMAVTYKELIDRQPVMQAVVDSLGLSMSWQSLRNQVKVIVVEGTQLIQITVEASSPEAARRIADEVAYQLILYAPNVFRNVENEDVMLFVQQQLTNLQDRIEAGHNRMTALESAMVTTTSAERLGELQAEAKTLEALIADWENNYTQLLLILQSKKNLNKLTVIEAAQANTRPIRPRPEVYVLVGVGIAFFLALGLIFLIDHIENTIKSPDEITQDFDLPILGYIAKVPGKKTPGVLDLEDSKSAAFTESYLSLRAQLELCALDQEREEQQPLRKILITSCERGTGKTSVATNLATIIGQGEKGVVLVDADLWHSKIHELLGLSNEVGLSDLIRNGKDFSETIQNPTGKFKVITSGSKASLGKSNPFETLDSKKMDKILATLAKNNEVVILDSPPLILSDALLLSTKVDGVLLVVQIGRTRRKHLRSVLERLARVNARVLGVVLNQTSAKDAQYFGEIADFFEESASSRAQEETRVQKESRTSGSSKVPEESVETENADSETAAIDAGQGRDGNSFDPDELKTRASSKPAGPVSVEAKAGGAQSYSANGEKARKRKPKTKAEPAGPTQVIDEDNFEDTQSMPDSFVVALSERHEEPATAATTNRKEAKLSRQVDANGDHFIDKSPEFIESLGQTENDSPKE